MNEPMFDSVDIALRVAYHAEIDAAYPESSTNVAIKNMMKSSGSVFDEHHTKRVDLKGLTDLDYFAQCALIRQVVEESNLLTLDERYAVWARYAWNAKKEAGYKGVAVHVEALTTNQGACLLDIVRSVYVETPNLAVRAIADRHNIAKTPINSDQQKVRSADYSLQCSASLRLDAKFKEMGVVGELLHL